MGAGLHQRIVGRRRLVEVEHARNVARLRREANRQTDIAVAIVQHRDIDPGDRRRRIGRYGLAQSLIAAGRDHLLAGRVDHDDRHRRARARHPQRAADVDAFARKCLDDGIGDVVILVAQRADVTHLGAEARRSDRGIAGLAAAGDQEFRRRHLGAGLREVFHPHDDVLHGAAGAQDSRCRFSQSGSRPRPRRG